MCDKSGQIPQFLKQKSTAKVWPGNIAKIGREKLQKSVKNVAKNRPENVAKNRLEHSCDQFYLLWTLRAVSIGYKYKIRTCDLLKNINRSFNLVGCLGGRLETRRSEASTFLGGLRRSIRTFSRERANKNERTIFHESEQTNDRALKIFGRKNVA